MKRTRILGIAAVVVSASLSLGACSNPTETSTSTSSGDAGSGGSSKIIVSSANFSESEIIGNLYAEALKAKGVEVETKFNIGSREAYIPALSDGSIDLIPDYTGNLLLFLDPNADVSSPEKTDEGLPTALDAKGLMMFTPATAEDKDALVVTAETAQKWNLKTLADLSKHNSELIIGGSPEFQQRPVGLPGLKSNYGIEPKEFVPISDGGGPATVQALIDGKVSAANIYTTTPAITENNFVVLEDPKNNFPDQRVVPVINKAKSNDTIESTIDAISAKLTTEELIKLNTEVSGDKKVEPQQAATDWLKAQGLM